MKSTDELINDLKKQDQTSFLENETDYVQSGGAYLSKLLKEHHLQPGNLIRDLELERSYAYQILRGTRKPTRILLLRIGFYLQLSLSEFQRMLSICQRAILYPRNRFDAAIIYALEHNMSIDDLNDLLFQGDHKERISQLFHFFLLAAVCLNFLQAMTGKQWRKLHDRNALQTHDLQSRQLCQR